MDTESLSRIQFALTVSFHFLFPPTTIGLGVALVIMQTLRLRTGNPLYRCDHRSTHRPAEKPRETAGAQESRDTTEV